MPDPVSGVLAASAVVGAGANIFGAQSAAEAQREAAAAGSRAIADQQAKGFATQKDYFDQGVNALRPIADTGSEVYKDLVSKLPDLTAPIVMDQAALEATPGYKFTQAQGIRGIDLSSISRGLSGAQAKAAAQFATNLADTTYKTQFDIANTNKTNAFNRLLQTATVGTDAAKSIAGNATSAGNAALGNTTTVGGQLSGNAIGAGNATAAAEIATGRNVSNALTGAAGAYAGGQNPLGNYSGNWAVNNPGVAGSAYEGPVAPGMYGR
ncbi:MAG: hypothetical protein JWR80_10075 [Bradyrhizobium sp.]|nr:hypothetical protein [Bradyrhizobium sp.]